MAALALLGGCGGGTTDPQASQAAQLAARLPSDGLTLAVVDVDAVRRALGFDPGTSPPGDSQRSDLSFLAETGPALGILGSGDVPSPVTKALLDGALAIASVAGDHAATAIHTASDGAELGDVMLAAGLRQEEEGFVNDDPPFAVAIAGDVVAIAESPGDAGAIVESDPSQIPEPLDQLDGEGDLISISRFGSDCLDFIASLDSPGQDGEVAFFPQTQPDPSKVQSAAAGIGSGQARIDGDSVRVPVAAADDPAAEPVAYRALNSLSVDYDCDAG